MMRLRINKQKALEKEEIEIYSIFFDLLAVSRERIKRRSLSCNDCREFLAKVLAVARESIRDKDVLHLMHYVELYLDSNAQNSSNLLDPIVLNKFLESSAFKDNCKDVKIKGLMPKFIMQMKSFIDFEISSNSFDSN